MLRLRKNRLRSIAGIGLEKMKQLRVLDLRENELEDVKEIAELVNKLRKLEFIGIAGNRCAGALASNTYKSCRLKLIGSVKQLRQIGCPLVYVDEDKIDGTAE